MLKECPVDGPYATAVGLFHTESMLLSQNLSGTWCVQGVKFGLYFEVEPTGIADRGSCCISSPKAGECVALRCSDGDRDDICDIESSRVHFDLN